MEPYIRRVAGAPGSAAQRVVELFEGQRLTPAQRRIAQCLVAHAPRAAYLSSGDLAALAEVSQPSVTRFAMALGYDGYPALRERLRVVVDGDWHRPATAGTGNQYQRALAAEIANLQHLSAALADGDGAVVD